MQVCPENASRDPGAGVEHVVMIVPVDPDINEAEHVAHEHWNEWCERSEVIYMRNLQLKHHDRNDDGDYTVAEGLESVLAHICHPEGPTRSASVSTPLPPQALVLPTNCGHVHSL